MQSKSSRNLPCVPLSVAENKATHVKLRNSARPGREGSYQEAVASKSSHRAEENPSANQPE